MEYLFRLHRNNFKEIAIISITKIILKSPFRQLSDKMSPHPNKFTIFPL